MEKKKILIIAPAQSTHTHSWIGLIDQKKFDIRLFGLKNTNSGGNVDVFNYCFTHNFPYINAKKAGWLGFNLRKILYFLEIYQKWRLEEKWLAEIIRKWRPDIIHTLGINPSVDYFYPVLKKFDSSSFAWVITVRGGSDLELERFNQNKLGYFRQIFSACDAVIADNKVTLSYAYKLGLDPKKRIPLDFVPGTGGIDAKKFFALRKKETVKSRIILWPKACEATYSKGLPVLEAIKLSWKKIQPCTIYMTVVDKNFESWLNALPEEIRRNIKVFDRVPRKELIKMMARSRVVLLPSLVDGIPNALYEAMGCKTFPIVSPLSTIKSAITDKNVLFARNLYPNEIAKALVIAMTDDELVKKTIKRNMALVQKIANRKIIGHAVNEFYDHLCKNLRHNKNGN